MISAKIVADSISSADIRLTTLELNYPRFIHSEMMTHRMFSRNAASSRAIPIEKMIKQVIENPAMPIHWGRNQPGMQAKEEIEDGSTWWKSAARSAAQEAEYLMQRGYHKQIVNRLLEPFQWMKMIVTATEWDNFFVLRLPYEELNSRQRAIVGKWKERFKNNPDGKDAQPEIQELARCMKKAMDESVPQELKHGEWHLPYVDIEEHLCYDMGTDYETTEVIKCSVARCARISYLNHDNSNPDIQKDIALADKLLAAGHMSPLEHQATPMRTSDEDPFWWNGMTHRDREGVRWSGNFRGWIMHRQLI